MSSRSVVALVAVAALAVPAVALAEVGPHSTWYAVHKQANGTQNNVNIVVQRNKGVADVNGTNRCLGSFTPSGSTKAYLNSFDVYPVKVSHGKINFRGKANLYIGNAVKHPQIHISVTVRPKKAFGHLSIDGTKCGTIQFTAPVALVRK